MDPIPEASGPPCQVLAYRPLPLLTCRIHAGFASPADDHVEGSLDLSLRFVRRPTCSFIAQVEGDSMIGEGIRNNDYVLVDRSRDPRDGDVVFAIVDGDKTIRMFRHDRVSIWLESANPGFPPIPWRDGCEVWGVISSVHRDQALVTR